MVSQRDINTLQCVQNALAKTVIPLKITELCRPSQFALAPQYKNKIKFKLAIRPITFKTLNTNQPN